MRELTAKDVMNPEILKVRDDMTVAELAEFLVENEISGVPVGDAEGRLVGVVSLSDAARSLTSPEMVLPDSGLDLRSAARLVLSPTVEKAAASGAIRGRGRRRGWRPCRSS